MYVFLLPLTFWSSKKQIPKGFFQKKTFILSLLINKTFHLTKKVNNASGHYCQCLIQLYILEEINLDNFQTNKIKLMLRVLYLSFYVVK